MAHCAWCSSLTNNGVEPQGGTGWIEMVVAQGGVETMSLHIGLICSTWWYSRQADRRVRDAGTHTRSQQRDCTHAVNAIVVMIGCNRTLADYSPTTYSPYLLHSSYQSGWLG